MITPYGSQLLRHRSASRRERRGPSRWVEGLEVLNSVSRGSKGVVVVPVRSSVHPSEPSESELPMGLEAQMQTSPSVPAIADSAGPSQGSCTAKSGLSLDRDTNSNFARGSSDMHLTYADKIDGGGAICWRRKRLDMGHA